MMLDLHARLLDGQTQVHSGVYPLPARHFAHCMHAYAVYVQRGREHIVELLVVAALLATFFALDRAPPRHTFIATATLYQHSM